MQVAKSLQTICGENWSVFEIISISYKISTNHLRRKGLAIVCWFFVEHLDTFLKQFETILNNFQTIVKQFQNNSKQMFQQF